MAKKPFIPIPPMAELPPAKDINVAEILDRYLSGEIDLICVLGPTASGKTKYAVRLAREINALLSARRPQKMSTGGKGEESVLPPWPQGAGPTTKEWEGLSQPTVSQAGSSKTRKGAIDLPLSPDYDERPRQKIDFRQGKPAHTEYEIVRINGDGTADLLLHPHTGRTHQLRVHCAHHLGLGRPIVGDLLYGGHSVYDCNADNRMATSTKGVPGRLCLHALSITFRHPETGQELTFTSDRLSY